MEVPRLGVKLELQLLAYTTATGTPDLRHVCNLRCSLRQCQILNPLIEARDRTYNLMMVTSQIRFHCATTGTPLNPLFICMFSQLVRGIVLCCCCGITRKSAAKPQFSHSHYSI